MVLLPSPHATGSWWHEMHRTDRAKKSSKGRRKMATARVVKVFLLGVALVLAVLYTFIFIVTSTTSSGGVYHLENGSFREADDNYLQQQLPYQCALVWLRIPKTASTTVVRRFMTPLVKAANLTNTGIRPNTCVTNVGGCAGIWQGSQQQAANHIEDRSIIAPPDGISSRIHHSGGDSQRCLLSTSGEEETRCWEYDSSQSTVTRNAKNNKTSVAARFNAHPSLHTHVALDPSLFGWVLPRNPMLFSTFRRPVERLLSSFHYGIRLGGDRPGQVKVCSLPGVANLTHWQNRVVAARAAVTLENNYTLYHQALREYLDACRDVVSNVYVQFLDPMTKNVSVALQHLEKYVIVGMQGDLDESLQRWAKIAVSSCRDHPNINRIRKDLITEPRHVGAHFRQSVTLTESNGGDEDNNTAELASPTINELDADLQQLIRTLTVDDEVIFQRAEELYEEQGHWFKSSSVR